MNAVAGALLPLIVTLALGFFAGWRHDFTPVQASVLNRMVLLYALPLMLFAGMVTIKRSTLTSDLGLAAAIAAGMLGTYLVTFLIVRFALRRPAGLSALTALQHGWTGFSGLQPEYSLAQRDAERDLLPMARAFGMTVTPWSPLANGLLTGKYNSDAGSDGRLAPGRSRNQVTERGLAIAEVVMSVADEIGCTAAQVALAWLVHQPGSVIPIIGARRVEQLDDNLRCLDIELTDGHLERLDKASRIDRGFPHDFIASTAILDQIHGTTYPRITARPRWGQ
jgi:hypothetical protein